MVFTRWIAVRTVAATLVMGCVISLHAQGTITVNELNRYQTIEGIGSAIPEWRYSINNNTTVVNNAVNDLGLSMLRVYPEPSFESSNENSNVSSLDLSRFNISASAVTSQFNVIKKYVAAGMTRLILSTFTPPAWMKDNNSLIGGSIRTDMYDEYAEFYAAYCKAVKQECGIDVYAISPENEPAWEQWYNSCVFSPTQMRDATKAIGRRLEQEGLSHVKIFGAEDLINNNWTSYFGATMADTVSRRYLYALAVHAYENDGATAGSPSATRWLSVAARAIPNGKAVWQTETSGYFDNWTDAFSYGTGIYTALKYGQVSAWVYLNVNTDDAQTERSYSKNGTPQWPYYTAKNFSRWIRPGAVMVDAVSSDSANLLSVAFHHADNRTLTLVVVNQSNSSRNATVAGHNIPAFSLFRSSSSERCVSAGQAASGATISFPAQSITTLHGTDWQGRTVEVTSRPQAAAPARAVAVSPENASAILRLDGRRVALTSNKSLRTGVYLVQRSSHSTVAKVPIFHN
jgi:glucuronoarabinoxylan endo-1,4-beta-xylanase